MVDCLSSSKWTALDHRVSNFGTRPCDQDRCCWYLGFARETPCVDIIIYTVDCVRHIIVRQTDRLDADRRLFDVDAGN